METRCVFFEEGAEFLYTYYLDDVLASLGLKSISSLKWIIPSENRVEWGPRY
jgi:hypothetical protein